MKCSILPLPCYCFCTQFCQINNTNKLKHHNPKASDVEQVKLRHREELLFSPQVLCYSIGVRYQEKSISKFVTPLSAVKPDWKCKFTLHISIKYDTGIPDTFKGELTATYNKAGILPF